MPRDRIRPVVRGLLLERGGWVSGKEITDELRFYNPSSVRAALVVLYRDGEIERKTTSGGNGKGSANWYQAANPPALPAGDSPELQGEILNPFV